jgi:serine/threonine protein kinase
LKALVCGYFSTDVNVLPNQLIRAARALAALNHPHICQLNDVGPNYLVMEFVEGQPLQGRFGTRWMRRVGRA